MFLQAGSDLPDLVTSEPGWAPRDVVLYNPTMIRVTAVISPGHLDDFDDDYDGILEVEHVDRPLGTDQLGRTPRDGSSEPQCPRSRLELECRLNPNEI